MAPWTRPINNTDPDSLQQQLAGLQQKFKGTNQELRDTITHRLDFAIAACDGDHGAREKYFEQQALANLLSDEIALIEDAIKATKRQQEQGRQQLQAQRDAVAKKRRSAILDARECEAREHLQATIMKFEKSGQHHQAELYRQQLATLRQRLEQGAA